MVARAPVVVDWVQNLLTEARLTRLGMAHLVVQGIPLSEIDIEGSLQNNARLAKQWNENVSVKYAELMEKGHPFVMCTLLRLPAGGKYKYSIMAGIHRTKSLQYLTGVTTLDAYVVDCVDEYQIDLVIRTDNTITTGETPPPDEVYHHIHALMAKYNKTMAEMSDEFGIKIEKLRAEILRVRARERLEGVGINTSSLNKSAITELGKMDANDSWLKRGGYIAVKYQMQLVPLQAMTKEVREAKSEKAGLEVIARIEEELKLAAAIVASTPTRLHTRPKILTRLQGVFNYLNYGRSHNKRFQTLSQTGVTSPEHLAELQTMFNAIITHVRQMLKGVPPAAKTAKRPRKKG